MKKVFTFIITSFFVLNMFGQENYIKMFNVGGGQFVTDDKINTNGHEYVDLGLSVLWATCNVGATNPEDYGDYYAWGETTPKTKYEWNTYKYCNGSYYTQTKYCFDANYSSVKIDYKTVLEKEDDVANAIFGGDWRMPTTEEFEELFIKCDWNWTQKACINGCEITGPNGNSIFLPTAGINRSSSITGVGNDGYYWTSSLEPITYRANSWQFTVDSLISNSMSRYFGLTVRPVLPRTLSLNKVSDSLYVDDKCTLIASCYGREVVAKWSSSNESVATISNNGVVTAVSAGTAIISAKYNDEKVVCKIIVEDKMAIVAIPDPAYINKEYTLLATFKGDTITGATWSSSNRSIAKVNNGVLTALSAGTVTVSATFEGETADSEILVIEPEYVDLGLSVLWATCNVGAATPEDYGDYFAWGETIPKNDYSEETYKFLNISTKKPTITKYCTKKIFGPVDKKIVLETEDDAANANLGGDWRMPTKEEFTELKNCTWTLTQKNGIGGFEITGPNGNSIFLPAAGEREGTGTYRFLGIGRYWSSSLNLENGLEGPSKAYSINFFDFGGDIEYAQKRTLGKSVRPVLPKLLTLNKVSDSLFVGDECTLIASCNGKEVQVEWYSSNELVATVNGGVVKALSVGSTTILAKYNGQEVDCKITVENDMSIVSVPKLTYVNKEYKLKTTLKDDTIEGASWASSNTAIATINNGVLTTKSSGTVTISATYESKTTSCEIFVIEPEYVDLGLSVMWATCNVGTTIPEDYGDYFAWGETMPKTEYNVFNYKYYKVRNPRDARDCIQTKYCTEKKYGIVDNKTVLELEDDAAHVNWGGDWRMPTEEEFDELIKKCTWFRTIKNGIYGFDVTGPNGKSIFLPAAGGRGGIFGGTYFSPRGYNGYYWCSNSKKLSLHKERKSLHTNQLFRHGGATVRPVLPKSLTLNKLSDTLFVDGECTLIATCNEKKVDAEWYSSNESVAIVSGGVIKALSAGITTISAKYNGKKVDCNINVYDNLEIVAIPEPAYLKKNYTLLTTFNGDTITGATWTSSNKAIAKINSGRLTTVSTGTVTITTSYKGKKAQCKILVIEPEYVDLGLSVKWATCNVGAINPEDYGDYFAWGEIKPKTKYNWSTYRYCNGTKNSITKYCTNADYGIIDNKTVLELEDDAAHVNLGGDWRIPTEEEQNELRNKCTWRWIQRCEVNGYKVTGPNGNSIFLPATGDRWGFSTDSVGYYGYYWSNSLYSDKSSNANMIRIDSKRAGITYNGTRSQGISIRPVLPKSLILNQLSDTLFVDGECTLIATCNEKNVVAEWYSSNESVAIVSGGVVKALSAGITTITAKYKGEIVESKITVNNNLAILSAPDPAYVNMKYKLIATFKGDTISNANWTSSNTTVASVTNGVLTALSAGSSILTATYNGEKAECKIVVIEPEFVDLGLSVKWATCNVGASTPEDYGDYFAWGEITHKTKYDWSTYKYCNGIETSITKYCKETEYGEVDNKMVLKLSDDAANVYQGGSWRIPTIKEIEELRKKCNWIWTQKNNIYGYKVTGPNGNSIFLPAGGWCGTTPYHEVGLEGCYWSSLLDSNISNSAHCLSLELDKVDVASYYRCIGLSVRPVLP